MSSTDVSAITIPVSSYFTHALMGFKGIPARPTKQAISDATFISRLISSLPDPYKRCSALAPAGGPFRLRLCYVDPPTRSHSSNQGV